MINAKKAIRSLRPPVDGIFLDERKLNINPIMQFEAWMEDALKAPVKEPNAMTLATVGKNGFPDARIVLLRGFDKNGFSFFTNYKSVKGKELSSQKACLNFFWIELARQVRIIGKAKKLSAKESEDYFNSRPRESQIGAWASQQSEVVSNRHVIDERFKMYEEKFNGKLVPRPPHWGGYLIAPISVEFWQGRPNRLHDRILYTKQKSGKWMMSRLSP